MTTQEITKKLKDAFEAGREFQIGIYTEYHGGGENKKPDFTEWIKSIESELAYLESQQQEKTAEEILHEHVKDSQWYAPVCDKRVIEAMEEYASQGQHEVSDLRKELIKFFKWFIPESIGNRMVYEQYIDEYIKKVKQLTGK